MAPEAMRHVRCSGSYFVQYYAAGKMLQRSLYIQDYIYIQISCTCIYILAVPIHIIMIPMYILAILVVCSPSVNRSIALN